MSQSLPERSADLGGQASLPANRLRRADDRRRRTEATVLSLISLVAVWWPRFAFESSLWLAGEIALVLGFALLSFHRARERHRLVCCGGLLGSPLLFALVARQLGSPISFEMTAMSMLGVGSLALVRFCQSSRSQALSVVSSGFLVLFATLTMNELGTPVLPIAWITFCLWHLVANHWERVAACTPEKVQPTTRVRPLTVVVGLVLFVVVGWAIHGRAARPRLLPWGFMPSSGGSSWSDPAARSGVGSGDAAIAAKDHAESFGAVESELFLESTESSLYDMFNDSIGEPKLKPKWERRQAMTPDKLIESHQQVANSERSGGSFPTSRRKPQSPSPLQNRPERAVLQWIGPTGIRLAMNRYDAFDGVDWSQRTSLPNEPLSRVELNGEAWFFAPQQAPHVVEEPAQFHHAGVLKVLRLDSTRIPSPMMTAGVHIKNIDRSDFFGIDHDGALFMPARERIPPLTVFHLASTTVMEDELVKSTSLAKLPSRTAVPDLVSGASKGNQREAIESRNSDRQTGLEVASQLAQALTANETNPYRQLQAIITHLRGDYRFDRNSVAAGPDPLYHFLVNQRGGDHLFATAAAVMGRAIGLKTRLVTGFYVRPRAFDVAQGHASVMPEDVHVWAEVQLNDGRWIELEPTPGYRQPVIKPTPWLLAKRFAAAYWPYALSVAAMGTLIFLTRVVWFELLVRLMWLFVRFFPDRLRVRVLLWVLQQRGRFAGRPRRSGLPQRDWILALTRGDQKLSADALACCDAADRMFFGGHAVEDWSGPANLLFRQLTTRYISRARLCDTSPTGMKA